jgi:uncharacterized YigZ family protein
MSVVDHYQTLAEATEFRHKIERSEFLGIAFPLQREEDFAPELTRIQKRDFDATHHCWAFRLFAEGRSRSADAGEPSGTAGKPILNAIEGATVHDVGVIVVRWYGGVKLGTGGLSRAYRDTAARALEQARRLDVYLYERIRVTVPFEALNLVYRMVDPPNILLAEQSFGETNEFSFDVRRSVVDGFKARLMELRLAFGPATGSSPSATKPL